jgi:hypothetical protein|nr:MAG TPA: hypothetical protein [Caudoviricetes sp.]
MEENELQELLIDTQKEYTRSNKVKDKIIVLLIVLMFLEAVVGYFLIGRSKDLPFLLHTFKKLNRYFYDIC